MKNLRCLHLLTIRGLCTFNILIVLGLWITGFLSGLNPVKWGWLSLIGYAFPFFLVATTLFMAVWIFIRKRLVLISFVGLLVAYYPVTLYCPCNMGDDVTRDQNTLKLMSYNVCSWGMSYDYNDAGELSNEEKHRMMLDYFRSVDADIVAVQEGQLDSDMDSLRNIYHYSDTVYSMGMPSCCVLLLSKYPITRKENLRLESMGNGAGAFWVNVNGREIIVIGAHLESMKLSVDDKKKFSHMMHTIGKLNSDEDENTDSVKNTSKTIFGKILAASKQRAPQAEKIARFIEGHKGIPVIVMGDFNDIPQSYTHDVISDQLQDCYRKKGFGPGYSYRHFGMRARIDNILCTEDFTPISCEVDKSIEVSDHQPIISLVEMVR